MRLAQSETTFLRYAALCLGIPSLPEEEHRLHQLNDLCNLHCYWLGEFRVPQVAAMAGCAKHWQWFGRILWRRDYSRIGERGASKLLHSQVSGIFTNPVTILVYQIRFVLSFRQIFTEFRIHYICFKFRALSDSKFFPSTCTFCNFQDPSRISPIGNQTEVFHNTLKESLRESQPTPGFFQRDRSSRGSYEREREEIGKPIEGRVYVRLETKEHRATGEGCLQGKGDGGRRKGWSGVQRVAWGLQYSII